MNKCVLQQHPNVEVTWPSMETVDKQESNKPKGSADDDDAYGEKQKAPKETKKITKTATLTEFIDLYIAAARDFFEHREIAKWQARQFDKCIDNLPRNHIAILIDYSMNYSHVHLKEAGGEHWSHGESTQNPIMIFLMSRVL